MAQQDRKTYIGSSDARAILNGEWDKLYKKKKGLIPDDFEQTFAMLLGEATEQIHLDWTMQAHSDEQGYAFQWSKEDKNGEQHHAEFVTHSPYKPRLISHPDALGRDPGGMTFPVEAKLTARFRTAEEAADYYMPQIQHHLICWDAPQLLFSVVIGTSDPQRIWIGRSLEWENHYLERCDDFWSHVVNNEPPAPAFYDTHQPKPVVPTAIANSVPLDGMTRRDMTGNNRWKAIVNEYLETKEAVAKHEKAKTDLKEMMQPDESSIYDDQIELKRDKRGAIRFNIKQKDAA